MDEFLVINQEEVRAILTPRACNDMVEACFRQEGEGKARTAATVVVPFTDPPGRCALKSGYLGEGNAYGIKVIRTHPGNPARGLPTMHCQILVVDGETGALRALMDGVHITRLRTGSAGAVGARRMALPGARRVAVIGAGVQGEAQLEALAADRPLAGVKVWSRTAERREGYARTVGERLELQIQPTASIENAVRDADIIITATWSFEPLIKSEWVKPGTYIAAIGADAPGMQELDPVLLRGGRVVVDDVEQCARMGEINVPLAKGLYRREMLHGTIGELCAGLKPGRLSPDDVTIFDSTGVGIQDAVAAQFAYNRALELGIGQRVYT